MIKPLTSLRGLAALTVMGYHFFGSMLGLVVLARGYLGVDLFFLLSGFVLFHVYHADRFSLWSFLIARVARTYPLHLFTLLMFLPAFGRSEAFSGSALLCNLSMVQAVCGVKDSWNGVSWSLSAEWFAYLLFPFIINPIRQCPVWISGILLVICLSVLAAQGDSLAVTFGPLALCRSLPEFLVGMVAYRMFEARLFVGWGWFVCACSAVVLAGWLSAPDFLIVVALIVVLVSAPGVALLEWKPLVLLGNISYSLYMIHFLIGLVILAIVPHRDVGSVALVAVVASVLSIGFAALTYRTVEVPARVALRSWLDGSRQGPARYLVCGGTYLNLGSNPSRETSGAPEEVIK